MKVAGVELSRRDLTLIALFAAVPLFGAINLIIESPNADLFWWQVGTFGTTLLLYALAAWLTLRRRRKDAAGHAAPPSSPTR